MGITEAGARGKMGVSRFSFYRPTEDTSVEEVSAYDIKEHPDYKFRPGHVVVRVGGFKVLS